MARYEENEKKPIYTKWWFWLIIVILIVAVVGGSSQNNNNNSTIPTSSEKETVKESIEELLEVDYNILYQEYQDNAIGADSKYKGKMLKLTGAIDDINREIAGNPYINFRVGEQYSFKDIRLTFKKSEEEKVSSFKKGQTITVKGKCSGQLITGTVSLNDCEIIN